MNNTQITAQPQCFSSVSSLASSAVFTREIWKPGCFSLTYSTKMLPKQLHMRGKCAAEKHWFVITLIRVSVANFSAGGHMTRHTHSSHMQTTSSAKHTCAFLHPTNTEIRLEVLFGAWLTLVCQMGSWIGRISPGCTRRLIDYYVTDSFSSEIETGYLFSFYRNTLREANVFFFLQFCVILLSNLLYQHNTFSCDGKNRHILQIEDWFS